MVGTRYGDLKLFKAVVFLGGGDGRHGGIKQRLVHLCQGVTASRERRGWGGGGEAGRLTKGFSAPGQVTGDGGLDLSVSKGGRERGLTLDFESQVQKSTSLMIYLKFMLPHPVTLSGLLANARSINIVTHLVNS